MIQAFLGIILAIFIIFAFSTSKAFADTIFTDDFSVDPSSNGWLESQQQIDNTPPPFTSTAVGNISPCNGCDPIPVSAPTSVIMEKTGGAVGVLLIIERTIDTTGFTDLSLNMAAFEDGNGVSIWEYFEIEIDTGSGFTSFLKDVQCWNGVQDVVGENPTGFCGGTTLSTSTGNLALPSTADNNSNFKVRISALINTVASDRFLDNFEVTGNLISTSSDSDGDGIPDDKDVCPGFDDNVDTDGDGIPDGCDETPFGLADLGLRMSGPFEVIAGDLIIDTIVVRNQGPDVAREVEARNPIPIEIVSLNLVSVEPVTVCSVVELDRIIICRLGDMAFGDFFEIIVNLPTPEDFEGTITNTASVGSGTLDPNPSDNTGSVPTNVRLPPPAFIKVTKVTISPGKAGPFDATISSSNGGTFVGPATQTLAQDGSMALWQVQPDKTYNVAETAKPDNFEETANTCSNMTPTLGTIIACIIENTAKPADHYLGYDVKETKGTQKFDKREVDLTDQFGSGVFEVKKPKRLYNSVDKNGEGISDLITHLVGYKISTEDDEEEDEVIANVLVTNQFGDITLDVEEAKFLLVPSVKDLNSPPPELGSTLVDHYKCYNVEVTEGTPEFERRRVSVLDPNFDENRILEVKNPKLLCNPVDKNGGGIIDEENHLLCYDVKPVKGEQKHEKRKSVFTNNQFGPEQLDTKKEKELCLPSMKTLLVVPPITNDNDGLIDENTKKSCEGLKKANEGGHGRKRGHDRAKENNNCT